MSAPKQYLLVDGYNVVHSWPETRTLLPRDIDAAAELLVERLAVLHDVEHYEVTVIFDGKNERTEIVNDGKTSCPCVIYAKAGLSADAIIEEIVAKAPDASAFTVVSRDNALGVSVFSSGAQIISPDVLLDMVTSERRSLSGEIAAKRHQSDRTFGNRLF